jgi:hypothetical protein
LGALTLAGTSFNGLLSPPRLQAKPVSADGRSVIFLWLPGGPPHLDTYDLKPDAPVEYRGEFNPIHTNVPGLDVCELLPRHAKIADKFTLIRSIAHTFADHGGGHKRFLTARDPLQPTGFVNDYPAVGSMFAKTREAHWAGLPNYIAGADAGRDGIDVFSFGSAYLGPATHPFMVPGDPSTADFGIRNLRMTDDQAKLVTERVNLLKQLDHELAGGPNTTADAASAFRERALALLATDTARVAFDLKREPQPLRDRYGMHPWGQRCLLARRLVEAGAGFVTMVLENPVKRGETYPKGVLYNWDSHAVNGHIFDDARFRLPILDQAVTALIEDIYARGLDKKVMIVLTGEFGRTPRIEQNNGRPGRDHWPQAQSVLVSGGGLKMGQVVGSTTSKGERPKDRPLSPNDLWATVLQHLGVDYNRIAFPDATGRPMPMLPDGAPIAELL